jgi:hypothetical protein
MRTPRYIRLHTTVSEHLADITVGLGPGFEVGINCDVAVETRRARRASAKWCKRGQPMRRTASRRVKLLEVDPRGNAACWTGIDERGRRIALAAIESIAVQAARSDARGDLKQLHWNSAQPEQKAARVEHDRL